MSTAKYLCSFYEITVLQWFMCNFDSSWFILMQIDLILDILFFFLNFIFKWCWELLSIDEKFGNKVWVINSIKLDATCASWVGMYGHVIKNKWGLRVLFKISSKIWIFWSGAEPTSLLCARWYFHYRIKLSLCQHQDMSQCSQLGNRILNLVLLSASIFHN